MGWIGYSGKLWTLLFPAHKKNPGLQQFLFKKRTNKADLSSEYGFIIMT